MAHATLKNYILGFCLSLLLTLAAFGVIEAHILSGHTFLTHEILRIIIVTLAVVQLGVQLYFFLHLGAGANARWNLIATAFALVFLIITIGGTLWIMINLSGRMAPSQSQMLQYMVNQSSAL
ncbi:MAG: cytochrome o ubiquinol oxidase subunit IV [Minisyncoccia bacterium]